MVFITNCTYKVFPVTRLKWFCFLASSKVIIKIILLDNYLLGKMHVLFIHEFKVLKLQKTRYPCLVLTHGTLTFTITSSILLLKTACWSIWFFFPKKEENIRKLLLWTIIAGITAKLYLTYTKGCINNRNQRKQWVVSSLLLPHNIGEEDTL